jgi:hypothetical protein
MLFMESVEGVTLDVQAVASSLGILTPLYSNDAAIDVSSLSDSWTELLTGPTFITDGNHENQNVYWGQSGGVEVGKTYAASRSGSKAFFYKRLDGVAGNRYSYLYYSGLSTTSRYYFEAWIKGSQAGKVVDAAVNNQFSTNSVTTSTTEWQRIRRYFTPTAATGYIYLRQETGAADDLWYMEDVIMCKVSTSTGFWPLPKSKAGALTYNEVSIPSAALSINDTRDVLGAATLDNVDVQMVGELTVHTAVLLDGEIAAETSTSSANMSIRDLNIFAGTLDVDVSVPGSFMILGFFFDVSGDLVDMDLEIGDINNFNFTLFPSGSYGELATVHALLYLVFIDGQPVEVQSKFTLDVLVVRTGVGMSLRRLRQVVLPPEPEPAVGGDPPAAGGTIIRALYGVVVDMNDPSVENGIPR